MATVQSSWKTPWLRKLLRYSLSDFELDQKARGQIVDHQMRKIGLAGDRAERGEFRGGETRNIIRTGVRICHAIEHRLVG